jgi:hypothetical protein
MSWKRLQAGSLTNADWPILKWMTESTVRDTGALRRQNWRWSVGSHATVYITVSIMFLMAVKP